MIPRAPTTRSALARLAVLAVLVAGFFAAAVLWGPHSAGDVRDAFAGLGGWRPIVVIAGYAVLTCALVPGPMLAGGCGLLFGTAAGTPVAVASAALGASLCFLIARRTAGGPVARLEGPRLEAWQARIEDNGFVAVLLARVAPAMPFAALSYAAGLTRLRLPVFAAATVVAAAPRAFAYVALGGNLSDLGAPAALAALVILVGMGLLGLALAWRARRRAASPTVPSRDPDAPPGPSPGLYSTAPADVAQLARASACHAEGRGFESHHPLATEAPLRRGFLVVVSLRPDRRQGVRGGAVAPRGKRPWQRASSSAQRTTTASHTATTAPSSRGLVAGVAVARESGRAGAHPRPSHTTGHAGPHPAVRVASRKTAVGIEESPHAPGWSSRRWSAWWRGSSNPRRATALCR